MREHLFDRVSFIGGGRVTRFLLEGWQRAGVLPTEIRVCDTDPAVLGKLELEFKGVRGCDLLTAGAAPLVILAVHPPDMKCVLSDLQGHVPSSSVVLSLAPKVTAASIKAALGVHQVVRMIPNAPSAVGRGYNPVSCSAEVDTETFNALAHLFSPWGEFPRVFEGDLEAYAIVSAMGPTYMWFQWQELRKLAVEFGLEPGTADKALLATLIGSAELLLAHDRAPGPVMDMVPVKPLKQDEDAFRSAYSARLKALYEKLRVG